MSIKKSELKRFKDLILKLPKAETHLHLEGLARVETVWSLFKKNRIEIEGIDCTEDLKKRFYVQSLDDFVDLYINVIQNSFKAEEDFELLIEDARIYLEENNIVYSEIFFSPTKFLMNGMDFVKLADILQKGAEYIKKESGISVNIIMDVSRSFGPDNAMKNLDLLLENNRDCIIGIGLGGSEDTNPARDYKEVFAKAKEHGLRAVAHAGESVGSFSIWDALQVLNVERIGHGTSAFEDEKLMDYLIEKGTPLEVCPTSNTFIKTYVNKIADHPIKLFVEKGLHVTLSSDDPTLFHTSLCEECIRLAESGCLSADSVIKILDNNISASFMPEKEKKSLHRKFKKIVKDSGY